MGSILTCMIQERTLSLVNKDQSLKRWYIISCRNGLACYNSGHYVESVWTCMIEGGVLFGDNRDLSATKWYLIWGQ
jgi:hypothetical protein